MDPDMEHHYRELLHQWKIDEDNVKDELKELGTDVKEMGTDVKEIGTDVKEIGTDVKDLTKKLDELVASTGTPAGQSSDEDGEYIETFKQLLYRQQGKENVDVHDQNKKHNYLKLV